ncbi:HTTM domain-containing protein [Microbacterium sp.]|uniref:HTTM domain-containing protein n=1 Tax=Microbacterium sp. TaxID=51671 RepID=UPI0039E67A44
MPLSERFDRFFAWLTDASHNLRSFSMLRILFGIGLLFMLVPSIPERSILWGPASFWVDPEASRRGFILFDVLISKDDPVLFELGFFALLLLAVLFTIGLGTRIVTPLMLIMLVSLQANNPYVLNGGDTLYRITLLFLVFANLSAHYSVDAFWAKRRRRAPRSLVPPHISAAAHNAALILCGFQIIVVYVVSGIWKLTGEAWPEGTALFYALRIDEFIIYPMINELLWQSSLLIFVATFIALWAQTLFPLALLWRPTRIAVLLTLMFMHTGIAVLLGLWPFSLAMIALDMLFIRDSSWEWIGARARRLRQRLIPSKAALADGTAAADADADADADAEAEPDAGAEAEQERMPSAS